MAMDADERLRCEKHVRLTLDLCQLGEDVMRQTLRRRHPTDDGAAIIAGVLRVHPAWPSRPTAGR